ncbi:MAG TPA: phosphate signaling complex protein PhoU [Caulobacteraceae bacterium]
MSDHIVRSFDEELGQITAEVARMGGLAEAQIAEALDCVLRRDVRLAEQVRERDKTLDAMEQDIEKKAIRLIALRQPMANDLRHAVAALKIASNLERCGDLAKNIAKRSLVLAGSEAATPLSRSIDRLGRLVAARLKEVLDAYTSSDVERAVTVWRRDEEIDSHYDSLFRELLTYMMGDPKMITPGAHLLFIAKNLERIGDHATNIAEIIHYELTGQDIGAERPKMDEITP